VRVDNQIGLEPTPDLYVAALVDVFAAVRRVLADDGTLWLNLADSYAANGAGSYGNSEKSTLTTSSRAGAWAPGNTIGKTPARECQLPAKNLVGIPWRVAFALQADGWILRSDIIWYKPNPMPESVTDRPTKAHEYLFLFAKSARYYYDAAAIAEPAVTVGDTRHLRRDGAAESGVRHSGERSTTGNPQSDQRNRRSVWTIPPAQYADAHFATYPPALIEPCILAGSKPGDLILDPFNGSGTTGEVAIGNQRSYVGIEINPAYVELARKRIGGVAPMFAQEISP